MARISIWKWIYILKLPFICAYLEQLLDVRVHLLRNIYEDELFHLDILSIARSIGKAQSEQRTHTAVYNIIIMHNAQYWLRLQL